MDSYNDPNANRIPQDMAECKQLSLQAFGDGAEETVKGASLDGFGGGTKQGFGADSTYKKIFIKCMRNRGHNVLN